LLIVASFIGSRLLTWLFSRWASLLTSKTETDLDDIIIEALKSPLNLIIIIFALRFSLGTLTLSESIDSFTSSSFHLSGTYLLRFTSAMASNCGNPVSKTKWGSGITS